MPGGHRGVRLIAPLVPGIAGARTQSALDAPGDTTDAEAICEAVTRPNMRFVPAKTVEQQSCLCLMLHRARHLFIRQQTPSSIQSAPILRRRRPASFKSNIWRSGARGRARRSPWTRRASQGPRLPGVLSLLPTCHRLGVPQRTASSRSGLEQRENPCPAVPSSYKMPG